MEDKKDKGWVLILIIVLFFAILKGTAKDLLGFLFSVALVCIVGQFVKRHQNRIDREIEKGIVHKYELKNNKIGDKNVVIEFAPPKGLSPIEVGYLYDMEIGESDIVCLLYKWAEIGIISLSYQDGGVLMVMKTGLPFDKNVPGYEVEFLNMLFEQGNIVVFPNDSLYDILGKFKNSVKQHCMDKGLINKEKVYFSVDDFLKKMISGKGVSKDVTYIPYGRLLGFFGGVFMIIVGFLVFVISIILDRMVVECGLIFVCLFFVGMLMSFSFGVVLSETANKNAIKLTEKGQEAVAEIHGYKDFLEKCDKRKYKVLMEEDPLYFDRILPYAVALGFDNIIAEKLPKNLSVEEGSLAEFLRFERVIY